MIIDLHLLEPKLSKLEQSIKHSEKSRPLFVSLFSNDKVQQAATRQGILFTIGDEHAATFHSEPPADTFRLVMAVVPSTAKQIKYVHNEQKQHTNLRFHSKTFV